MVIICEQLTAEETLILIAGANELFALQPQPRPPGVLFIEDNSFLLPTTITSNNT